MMPHATLPPGLYEATLAALTRARVRRARLQFALLSIASGALTLLCVESVRYFVAEAGASGFGSYLSLLMTNSTLLLTSREFALTLLESLPSFALLLLLLLGFSLTWSLTRAARSARSAFSYV